MDRQNRSVTTIAVGILAAAALLLECLAVRLFPAPLLDPDESLFAVVAREMRQSGDYLTPTYRGRPFLDRPVLYYWLLAGSSGLLGEGDFSYRLPSLLLGVGAVCATAGIASKLFGGAAGCSAALCMATSVGGAVVRLAVGHDSALVFFCAAAVYSGFSLALAQSKHGRFCWAAALALSLAGGLLSKGLLGAVLPAVGLSAVFWQRGERPSLRWFFAAILAGAAVAGLWYAPVEAANPGYWNYYFGQRHWSGFFTDGQRHGGKSAWIYLPTFLAAGFPWLLLLFDGRKGSERLREEKGLAVWTAATLLLFVVGRSRNPTYLLPITIPLAVWCGKRLAEWLANSTPPDGRNRWMARLPWLTGSLVGASAIVALWMFHRPISPAWWVATAAVALIGWVWNRRSPSMLDASQRQGLLAMQTFAWSGLTTTVLWLVLPQTAWERCTLSTLAAIRENFPPGTPIVWYDHVPPSGYLYGADLSIHRIYHDGLSPAPSKPTILVCRASRLKDVLNTPMTRGGEHSHPGGKFHLFFSPGFGPLQAN